MRNLYNVHGMGPIEQKWIIKILISKMQLGVTAEGAMSYIHKDMVDLYGGERAKRASLEDDEIYEPLLN